MSQDIFWLSKWKAAAWACAYGLGCASAKWGFSMGRRSGQGSWEAIYQHEDSLSSGEDVLENKLCLSRANRLLDLRVCWEHGLCCKNPMKSWKCALKKWASSCVSEGSLANCCSHLWKVRTPCAHGGPFSHPLKLGDQQRETRNQTRARLHWVCAWIPNTIFVHFCLHQDYFGF